MNLNATEELHIRANCQEIGIQRSTNKSRINPKGGPYFQYLTMMPFYEYILLAQLIDNQVTASTISPN